MTSAILGRNERVMLILVEGVVTVVDLNTGEILDELPEVA